MVSQVRDRCNMCAGRCREPRRKGTRVAAPSGCVVPWAARASCWPQPQQLLPVSAAGSGRRCCTGAFPRRTIRRVLRVALAAFSAAPWQGFEKAERCPSLASLFPPQAAVGSAAVRIHPCSPFCKTDKTETPVPGSDTGVLGGAKQPKSEPLPSGASLAAISSKVMVFVPSL